MPKCINLPRITARLWNQKVDPNTAWISIGDPGFPGSIFAQSTLDKLPNLKLSFEDLMEVVPLFGLGEYAYPPNKNDARQLVDFILLHRGKDFLVNCNIGERRSGAVCQFLQDCLGYEWDVDRKKVARP